MVIIGITGPTGAGKTTALKELEKLGGCIIDADAVYHELLARDIALRKELEDRFGPLTDEEGNIQRKKLGAIVFSDPAAMADLNAITHRYIGAAIRVRIDRAREKGCLAAAIDAIRLFESGLAAECDTTLAITAPPEVRIRRIMAREGIPEDYARVRVSAQPSDDFFTRQCEYVLTNDCASSEDFGARARKLFVSILSKDIQ